MSMGTHEHWNNATDKKYSRNLNYETGTGIELYTGSVNPVQTIQTDQTFVVYPNPASDFINISLKTVSSTEISVNINTIEGKTQNSFKFTSNGGYFTENLPVNNLAAGTYVVTIHLEGNTYSKLFLKK
jgi:hypothetical protein